jgi:hypothetical protein
MGCIRYAEVCSRNKKIQAHGPRPLRDADFHPHNIGIIMIICEPTDSLIVGLMMAIFVGYWHILPKITGI